MIVEVRYVSDGLHLSAFRVETPNGRLHKVFTSGCDEQTLQQTYFRGSARCVQSFDDSLKVPLRSQHQWKYRLAGILLVAANSVFALRLHGLFSRYLVPASIFDLKGILRTWE